MPRRISITLPDHMHKFLTEYKRIFGTPIATKVREMIANWIVSYDQQPTQPYVVVQSNMSVHTSMKTVQRNTGTLIAPVMSSEIKNEFQEGIAKQIRAKEEHEDWSGIENIDELRGVVTPDIGN